MNEKIQEYTERCYEHLAEAERLEAEYQVQLQAFRDESSDFAAFLDRASYFAAFLDGLRDDELKDLDEQIANQAQDLADVVRQDHVVAHDSDNVAKGEKPRNYHLMVKFRNDDEVLEGLRQLREAGRFA